MTQQQDSKVSVSRLSLPPSTTLVDVFSHWADTPWSMLLDSADSARSDARFSILVAQPLATITAKDAQTVVCEGDNQTVYQDDDPLVLAQQLKERLLPGQVPNDTLLPFLCGLMGSFGYDLGRRYERLPSVAQDPYRTPDLALGVYSWSVIADHSDNSLWLCRHHDHDAPTPQCIEQWLANKVAGTDFSLDSQWQSNLSEAQYHQRIDAIHDALQCGDVYQVNLAQRFCAQAQGSPWQGYLKLRAANKAPFSAFIKLPDSEILSLSPERFLRVSDGHVETKPIKGTRPRSEDPQQDQRNAEALLASDKDRAENLMIVDLLRNDLSRNCQPGSVSVPALFYIDSYPAVHHLVTRITGKLASHSSPLTLLRDAFPGGSITGAPKISAMGLIDHLEPHRRSIYCGSIGYVGLNDDMDTSICIRTLLSEPPMLYCWAGGGIVLDSTAASEYQESFDKVAKILPVLTTHHE
ncbi:aminodeoxychorismate synthase component I [Aestuariibacter halophilus]|uniref:aminodeoxychorismate synthase n=1 Tax=Fluctibacter halophilus TaxID=226011 RepID=A0ABS8G4E2_9ALTE|nr:aminodeoxychorismate synthase component I [Aestuariibacter halophilus]MCC2615464.1 aminodeoxychorismate synthase component I [Aestuariibacter halophilus]